MGFLMYVPTKTLFGRGTLNELHLQNLPGTKAMIAISNGKSTRVNGYLDRTQKELEMAGVDYEVFDKIGPNPLKEVTEQGGRFAKENGCDFIVALGGGSVMDASKAIAVMATNGGDLWDYMKSGTGKAMPIEKSPLPIVAITTTAGTGSETDRGGVITNPKTKEKIPILDDTLFPVLAIVDPELMKSVPKKFTAYQGFDALFHSTEGYISSTASLMSDMVAITAIENVSRNLADAVKDGDNLEARERVAFGNYLSGIQMCVGTCTSEHSLEHAMSAYHQDLPHGAGLIMISIAYYKYFIEKHVCDDRFIKMAKVMGKEDANRPEDFIEVLFKLQRDCGVDDLKMSDYGIVESEFDDLAQNALESMSGLFEADRVKLSKADCVEIYRQSYK